MAMKKFVVSGDQERSFYAKKFELERQWRSGVLDPDVILPVLQALNEPTGKKIEISETTASCGNWLSKILEAEQQAHLDFFGREFDLLQFEQILRKYGRKTIKEWAKLSLEPHFLSKASMMPGDDYPGWKVKPEQWFYKMLVEGKLFRSINGGQKVLTAELEGITVLVDTRLKPEYNNGKQMWKQDNLLGPIIEGLRREGKIDKYNHGPQSSRFGVSANEWEKHIKPALATKIGLPVNQVRLESTVERNVIPQLYTHMPRVNDGKTDTWVWVEEYFEGRGYRLRGGDSVDGGLADVHYFVYTGDHWSYRSLRPLVVL